MVDWDKFSESMEKMGDALSSMDFSSSSVKINGHSIKIVDRNGKLRITVDGQLYGPVSGLTTNTDPMGWVPPVKPDEPKPKRKKRGFSWR